VLEILWINVVNPILVKLSVVSARFYVLLSVHSYIEIEVQPPDTHLVVSNRSILISSNTCGRYLSR
jgi:hypothetical protein